MEVMNRNEVVDFLGCHERTLCYHIRTKNLCPLKVRGRKFMVGNKVFDLPKKYSNHTKTIFLKTDILNLFK